MDPPPKAIHLPFNPQHHYLPFQQVQHQPQQPMGAHGGHQQPLGYPPGTYGQPPQFSVVPGGMPQSAGLPPNPYKSAEDLNLARQPSQQSIENRILDSQGNLLDPEGSEVDALSANRNQQFQCTQEITQKDIELNNIKIQSHHKSRPPMNPYDHVRSRQSGEDSNRLNVAGYHRASSAKSDYQYDAYGPPLALQNQRSSQLSRKRSQSKKPSAFERCEELRYQGFLLEEKMSTLFSQMHAADQAQPTSNTVTISKDTLASWLATTQAMQKEFGKMQVEWNGFFDEQIEDTQKYRSKSKTYKKKLRGLENHSMMIMKDQKDLEKSLHDITKEHNENLTLIENDLGQFESQVSNLKATRVNINNEQRLDQAMKELHNFYNNLESAEDLQDTAELDKLFSLKPAHFFQDIKIESSFLQRPSVLSQLPENPPNKPASGPSIPKLQMYKIQERGVRHERNTTQMMSGPDSGAFSQHQPQQNPEYFYQQAPFMQAKVPSPQPMPISGSRQTVMRSDVNSQAGSHLQPRAHEMPLQQPLQPSARKPPSVQQSHRAPSSRREAQPSVEQQPAASSVIEQPPNEKTIPAGGNPEDEIITNPVMLGAMHLTSKFDNRLEEKDANVTLDMNTDRLKQFPEEYAMLQSIEDPDQRILLKQVVFMQFEKQLKKQLKQERKKKKKEAAAQKEQKAALEEKKEQGSDSKKQSIEVPRVNFPPQTSKNSNLPPAQGSKSLIPTPTNKSGYAALGNKFGNNCSSKGSLGKNPHSSASSNNGFRVLGKKNENALGMNEREINEYTAAVTSRFSLQSELPSLDTQDILSAQKRYIPQEVDQSALMNVEEELVLGLKSATQQSLVKKYEEEFKQKEFVRQQNKQNEKKLALSSSASKSQEGRVISQETLTSQVIPHQQYASNVTNQNPIYIAADLSDYSLHSDLKQPKALQKINSSGEPTQSKKSNIQVLSFEGNMDSRIPSIPIQEIDESSIHQKLILASSSEDPSSQIKSKQAADGESSRPDGMAFADVNEPEIDKINDSFLSGGVASQYRKILYQKLDQPNLESEQNGGSPCMSPLLIQNSLNQPSYINSDQENPEPPKDHYQSNRNLGKPPVVNNFVEQSPEESVLVVRVDNTNNGFYSQRQPISRGMDMPETGVMKPQDEGRLHGDNLPLDIIQERQSEFSQSVTNAQRVNTHRSKMSKQSHMSRHNPIQNLYANGTTGTKNMSIAAGNTKNSITGGSGHTVGGTGSALPSVRSDNHYTQNDCSTHRLPKGQSTDLQQKLGTSGDQSNYNNNGYPRISMISEMQDGDYRACNNVSANFLKPKESLEVLEEFVHPEKGESRNQKQKNSHSQKESDKNQLVQIKKQPSLGKLEQVDRQKMIKNFESDVQKLVAGFNPLAHQPPQSQRNQSHQNSLKKLKSKNQTNYEKVIGKEGKAIFIPPLSKSKSGTRLPHDEGADDLSKGKYFNSKHSRKNFEHHRRNGMSDIKNNYVNLTELNTERERDGDHELYNGLQLEGERNNLMVLQQQFYNYPPHSHRSHVPVIIDSNRNRSYFDEESTPLVFDKAGSALEHQSIDLRAKAKKENDGSSRYLKRKNSNSGLGSVENCNYGCEQAETFDHPIENGPLDQPNNSHSATNIQSHVYAEVDSMSRKSRMSQMLRMSPRGKKNNIDSSGYNQASAVGSTENNLMQQISIPQSSCVLSPNNIISSKRGEASLSQSNNQPQHLREEIQFHPENTKGTVNYQDGSSHDSNPQFDMNNLGASEPNLIGLGKSPGGELMEQIMEKKQAGEKEEPGSPRPMGMIRSHSECQLRDKEFYEMCDDEDEIAMYCKFAEQNIMDAIHISHARNFSQLIRNPNHLPQISGANAADTQQVVDSENVGADMVMNKSSSISNQLVFMSQRTFQRICGRYLQDKTANTQNRTLGCDSGPHGPESSATAVMNGVENYASNQTRGKATLKKFNDPTLRRLLGTSINNPNGQGSTKLLTREIISLYDGTLPLMHNQIMMPTHQYNRRTLLMMQNLHNNYLYSANSGILFTMQRGFNSGGVILGGPSSGGAEPNFKNMTNIEKYQGTSGVEIGLRATAGLSNTNLAGGLNNEPVVSSKNPIEVNSLGGDPVNISSLLMGAKQQTDQINVGSITIVDDDGRLMLDRKLLLEANNSNQTNARRLFSMSRNGQVTTSDLSNLQTKQMGIFRNNYKSIQQFHQNQADSSLKDYIDDSLPLHDHKKKLSSARKHSSHRQHPVGSQSSLGMSDSTQAPMKKAGLNSHHLAQNKTSERIKNLFSGLKSIQQKPKDLIESQQLTQVNRSIVNEGSGDRKKTGSDITTKAGLQPKNYLTAGAIFKQREPANQSDTSILTEKVRKQISENDYDGNSRLEAPQPKASLQNLKQMILKQQKNSMNMSSSINLNNSLSQGTSSLVLQNQASASQYSGQTLQISDANLKKKVASSLLKLKSKSQPKKLATNAHKVVKEEKPQHPLQMSNQNTSSQVSFKPVQDVPSTSALSSIHHAMPLSYKEPALPSSALGQASKNININKKNHLSLKRSSQNAPSILSKEQIKQIQFLQGKTDEGAFHTISDHGVAKNAHTFSSAQKPAPSKQVGGSASSKGALSRKKITTSALSKATPQQSFLVKKSSMIGWNSQSQFQSRAGSQLGSGRGSNSSMGLRQPAK